MVRLCTSKGSAWLGMEANGDVHATSRAARRRQGNTKNKGEKVVAATWTCTLQKVCSSNKVEEACMVL